ncbi:MAG: hypothetical protein GX810_00900 [Clostridiales bacterium]|nr:hypothetical protein [Clostridiales bacterium]
MAVKLLEKIRMAEQAAEQVRLDAQREAREMIKASEEASAHALRAADQSVRAFYREQMDQHKKRLEDKVAQALQANAGAHAKAIEQARAHMDQAAGYIVERILGDGDR